MLVDKGFATRVMASGKPPTGQIVFIHTSAVQGAEITHECYSGREVMKFYESGAALAQDIGVPVSKMEESSEAQHLASLKTAEDPTPLT